MTKDEIQSIFGSRIVSFHAVFAKAIGSVPAAVMLSQAFFWQEKAKHKDGVKIGEETFFSKTGEEWYEETGLTESQQLTARKHLLSAGFWAEKRAGMPAKMCYRIDVDLLVAGISRYLKTGQQVAVDSRKQLREIARTSSGKFRQQVAVKYGDTIKERELKESFEKGGEKKEKGAASPLSPPFSKIDEIFIVEEKEKSPPQIAPAPPQKAARAALYGFEPPVVTETAPAPHYAQPTARGAFGVDIRAEVEKMKTDPAAFEGFVLGRKLPREKFGEYLEAFAIEQISLSRQYPNTEALRLHCLNWCGTHNYHVNKGGAKPPNGRASIRHFGGEGTDYGQKQNF